MRLNAEKMCVLSNLAVQRLFFKQASLRLLNVRQQLCLHLWRSLSHTCLWFST